MSGLLGGSITGGSKINYSDPNAVSEAFAATYISARLEEFVGPHMLGMCFDLFLLGIVLHQMITYCSAPNKDRLYVKCTVYWVFGMAVVTSCYGIYYTWHFFVENFGVYSTFFSLRRVAIYNPLSAAITLPVQAFYLERAYKLLHKNIWVYIVMVPILAATLVSYIGLTWVMFDINSIAEVTRAGPWFYAWDSTMLASDAVLTALILYGLSKAKTGWSNTDRVVSQAIRTSVEAQLPATVYALGFILTYSIKPLSQVIFFWTMQHTKIYVISLLAVLNFRTTFRLANSSHNEGPVSHETPRNPGLSDTATHNTYGMKDIEACDKGNDAARRPRFTVEINRAARNSFGGPGNHFVPIEDVNEDQK